MFKRILVAVDVSGTSDLALETAIKLASEQEARHSGVVEWPTARFARSTGPAGRIALATTRT